MPPPPIRPRIPQPLYILQHRPPQLVLDLHPVQRGVEVQHLVLRQLAHLHRPVQVEARHELGAGLGADAEEGLEGAL